MQIRCNGESFSLSIYYDNVVIVVIKKSWLWETTCRFKKKQMEKRKEDAVLIVGSCWLVFFNNKQSIFSRTRTCCTQSYEYEFSWLTLRCVLQGGTDDRQTTPICFALLGITTRGIHEYEYEYNHHDFFEQTNLVIPFVITTLFK